MTFFNVIQWKNLLMIVLVQALIHYHLMFVFNLESNLSNFTFVLLTLASIIIAAGGYIINDIQDLEADQINKPDQVWIPKYATLNTAKSLYYFVSFLGLLLGVYVAIAIQNYSSANWFMLPIILLYIYAKWAKKVLFLGNILVAALIAFSLVLVVLFEGVRFEQINSVSISFLETIIGLVNFAFLLNLIREIIKDAQDETGDRVQGVDSIPIRFGKETTHIIIQIITGLLVGFLLFMTVRFYNTQPALVIYLVSAILVGLLLFLSQLNKVQKTTDYAKLSSLLKLLMLAGLFSVFFIQHHV